MNSISTIKARFAKVWTGMKASMSVPSALAQNDGQISEVARRLGIGRTTLYRKLKEYGIDVTSISGKGPGADEEGETTPFNRAAS